MMMIGMMMLMLLFLARRISMQNNTRYQAGCFYCNHSEVQEERMIEIMPLHVATVYLNKDQTHFGRVIVALNWHMDELFELTTEERNEFCTDVAMVAKAIKKITNAQKINYAIYGDSVSHLHFHLVPKHESDNDWNDAFVNMPEIPKFLKDTDYQNIIENIVKELEEEYEEIGN